MVKKRLYKFLSLAAISTMMATTYAPVTVNATEAEIAAQQDVEKAQVEETKGEEAKTDQEETKEEETKEEVKETTEKKSEEEKTEEDSGDVSEKEDSKKDTKEESKKESKSDSKKKKSDKEKTTESDEELEESEDEEEEDEESEDEKDEKDKKDKLKDKDDEDDKKQCEITYPMIDFDKDYDKGGTWGTEVTVKGGAFKLSYSGNYAEKVLGLPKGIKGEQVKAIKVNIKKGDKSGFSLKLRNEGEELLAAYGTTIIENKDKVDFDGIGLMNSTGDAATFTIESITLTLKGDVEDYPEPSKVEEVVEKADIEWDIPDLKDYVSSSKGLGSDSYTGAAIMLSEISDKALMDLVEKHFNAVTFGNELKPDALFNYQNDKPSEGMIVTETWTDARGNKHEDMAVPKLDFSRAEKMLDVLKDWNDEHPDDQIKVRGHVLTWHSQTPDWFFRENYDPNGAFVSPEEMTLRHEWFIKSVYEHVFKSEYKDMFYGWDVVNEACSDETGTYRNENERSNWAKIYGAGSKEDAPDYILNAFRFANYYAHKMGKDNLELYYNDYNECSGNKPDAIAGLLESVKRHESDETLPTRITGFGMQGHHNMISPSKQKIIDCGKRYGKIVGKIQVTELDFKCSSDFGGTDAELPAEYTKEAYRYKDVYDAYKEIDADPDIDVNGFTIWGVIDPNSWLQTSNSVGGGANGRQKQVPLLFDGEYKSKPAYWALVDPSKLEPAIKSITLVQAKGSNPFAHGKETEIEGTDYSFIPVWDGNKLSVKVKAQGAEKAKLYVDFAQEMKDGAEVKTVEAALNDEGECVLEVEGANELFTSAGLAMDVVVTDAEGDHAFNNLRLTQDEGSKYYAKGLCKPYMSVAKGTPEIDGQIDKVWDKVDPVELSITGGSKPNALAGAKVLWDENYLYTLICVKDDVLDASSSANHEKDSVEVFIDENNGKSEAYQADDKQYRINYLNEASFNGEKCLEDNCKHAVQVTDEGYYVESAFAWTDITPEVGQAIGLDLQINDGANGGRIGTRTWYDETGNGWSSPKVFGEVELADAVEVSEDPAEPENPEDPENPEEPVVETPAIAAVSDVVYTGKALKPAVTVVVGDKTLVQGTDYKVSYKNNKNAATKVGSGVGDEFDESLPTVIVKLKGDYEGELKANFTISPVDFADNGFEFAAPSNLKEKKKATAPNVTVKFNGKKLSKSEYAITYKLGEDGEEMKQLPAKASNGDGQYFAVVKATGSNFTGAKDVALDIVADAQVNILHANLKSRSVKWNENDNSVSLNMEYKVNANDEAAYFGVAKGTVVKLEAGKDYTACMVSYSKWLRVGLAYVEGSNPFFGSRLVIVTAK